MGSRPGYTASTDYSQELGIRTSAFPWAPARKSAHWTSAFDSATDWQPRLYMAAISLSLRSSPMRFTWLISPTKAWLASKPPPTRSWSCPRTREPPGTIVRPRARPLPSPVNTPSWYSPHEPSLLSQRKQSWSHWPISNFISWLLIVQFQGQHNRRKTMKAKLVNYSFS